MSKNNKKTKTVVSDSGSASVSAPASSDHVPGRLVPKGVLTAHYESAKSGPDVLPTAADVAKTFTKDQRSSFELTSGKDAAEAIADECAVAGLPLSD